jgi:membrane fusion protein (multidrug efflux system)
MIWIAGLAAVALAALLGLPRIRRAITTISTDDAYVNGHVTFVAPRVTGQVVRVLVDDNNRVRKGDVLVELDKEPYEVKVGIAEAAVATASADVAAAQAETRGLEGKARSLRFNLQNAIEGVGNQVALLHAKVATLESKKATLARVQVDYEREAALVKAGVSPQQKLDSYTEARRVAQAEVQEAQQGVYQVRVGLGLPRQPASGDDLTQVPPALEQSYSAVKEAQGQLLEVAAQLGVEVSYDTSPEKMLADFYKRDPEGNIDRIYAGLARNAPAVKRAEAKLAEAERHLDDARLDLRYCDVVAEIDGVVTRRSVNPGNNVVAGQSLMAVRSLTEIWVDANFKETQLAELRIGLPVDLDVDMYGSHERFRGRISGFTMGTGSTLSLLPAENATGNFVKVVQRLPVRIDLVDYDPDTTPLFIGLSVTPYVLANEAPSGPNAGLVLQPFSAASGAAATSASNATAAPGTSP